MFYWPQFIKLSYWFERQPNYFSSSVDRLFVYAFFLMIIISLAFKFTAYLHNKQKKPYLIVTFWNKMANFTFWMACLEILYYFFRYERVMLLSSRFWMLLWLITFLTWGGFILYYRFKKIPQIMSEKVQKNDFEKYLPKKKNR